MHCAQAAHAGAEATAERPTQVAAKSTRETLRLRVGTEDQTSGNHGARNQVIRFHVRPPRDRGLSATFRKNYDRPG
jgi:hypothetical protein